MAEASPAKAEAASDTQIPPVVQGRTVKVVARVRPVTEADGSQAQTSLLVVPTGASARVITLNNPTDKRTARQFKLDAVLGPDAQQEDIYHAAGIDELVAAAAAGYHATVFAYGQTGSGKTHTMEGYKYVGGAHAPSVRTSSSTGPHPHADFDGTPEAQLGIVPRAVSALFAALQRDAAAGTKRTTIRVSFVQLYKEQVYDLLNPAPLVLLGGRTVNARPGQVPTPAGALRMRWSKAEDFYLENLFKVECSTAEEVMAAFKSGVANKVMASHRLNAASSRSHAMFTLYIDSSPAASPSEVISSRLTLVDLAGSERQAQTGAVDGTLKEESLAINKSLLMLRQVIIALSNNAAAMAAAEQQQQLGSDLMAAPLPAAPNLSHVPYRDSKLTALLKNSLGGNSLTVMVACLAPTDAAYEENMSTLDYAARAKRVTNHVAVNEDPRTRLIRELRAEVAFLRSQLAAVAGPDAAAALIASSPHSAINGQQQQRGPRGPPGQVQGPGTNQGVGLQVQVTPQSITSRPGFQLGGSPGHPQQKPAANSKGQAAGGKHAGGGSNTQHGGSRIPGPAGAVSTGNQESGKGGDVDGSISLPAGTSMEDLKAALIKSTQQDVDVLAQKLLDAVALVQQLSSVNAALRSAYDTAASSSELLRVDNDTLMTENAQLRDKLSMLEAVAGLPGEQEVGAGGAGPGPGPGSNSSSPVKARGGPGGARGSPRGPSARGRGRGPDRWSGGGSLPSPSGAASQQNPSLRQSHSSGIQPGNTSQSGHGQGGALTNGSPGSTTPPGPDTRGGAAGSPAAGGGSTTSPASNMPAVYTAGAAALIELQELRQENALLHQRLRAAEAATVAVATGNLGPGSPRTLRASAAAHPLVASSPYIAGGPPAGNRAAGSRGPASSTPAATRPRISSRGGQQRATSLPHSRPGELISNGTASNGNTGQPRAGDSPGASPTPLTWVLPAHGPGSQGAGVRQSFPAPGQGQSKLGTASGQRPLGSRAASTGSVAGAGGIATGAATAAGVGRLLSPAELRGALAGGEGPSSPGPLASITAQVSTSALVNGVRMSTVGGVLPGAGAAALAGGGGIPRSGAVGRLGSQDPLRASHQVLLPPEATSGDPAERLMHLMTARNALARSTIADGP